MPSIAHANAKAIGTVFGTNVVATFPGSYAAVAGDLLMAVHVCATTAAVTTPAGWSLFFGPYTTNSNLTVRVYFKVAAAETTLTVVGPNTRNDLALMSISGSDAAAILASTVALTEGTAEKTSTATSIATSASIDPAGTNEHLFIAAFGFGGAPGAETWDNSFTQLLAAAGGGGRLAVAERTITNPGATSVTCDYTNNASARSVIVAIPALVPPATTTVPFRGFPRALHRGAR